MYEQMTSMTELIAKRSWVKAIAIYGNIFQVGTVAMIRC